MKRHALVIGINEWQDKRIKRLSCAENDAQSVNDLAHRLRFDRVKQLRGQEVTAAKILEALDEIGAGLGPGDLLVIYVSGHGLFEDRVHYIVCHDARRDDYLLKKKLGLFSLDVMLTHLRKKGVFDILLITDACREALDQAKDTRQARFQGEKEFRNLAAPMAADSSTVVLLSSCMENKLARELESHGLFTQALVDSWTEKLEQDSPIWVNTTFKEELRLRMEDLAQRQGWPADEQCPLIEEGRPLPYALDGRALLNPIRITVEPIPKTTGPLHGFPSVSVAIVDLQNRLRGYDQALAKLNDRTHPALAANQALLEKARTRSEGQEAWDDLRQKFEEELQREIARLQTERSGLLTRLTDQQRDELPDDLEVFFRQTGATDEFPETRWDVISSSLAERRHPLTAEELRQTAEKKFHGLREARRARDKATDRTARRWAYLVVAVVALLTAGTLVWRLQTESEPVRFSEKERSDWQARTKNLESQIAVKQAELERANDAATNSVALTRDLNRRITEFQKKFNASEGDRQFTSKELKQLQAEKAELEKKAGDRDLLRQQVLNLSNELSAARLQLGAVGAVRSNTITSQLRKGGGAATDDITDQLMRIWQEPERVTITDQLRELWQGAPKREAFAAVGSGSISSSATAVQLGKSFMNSLGMKFVEVPGTAALFCIWETRVRDYEAFVKATGREWPKPGFEQGPDHPAVMVSWEDARAFCGWLTTNDWKSGMLPTNKCYRLPTDLEWSVAVGLTNEVGMTPAERSIKVEGVYPWGTQWPPPKGSGNYHQSFEVDEFEFTSPVGSFTANRHGLFDMGGNVWQWAEDWWDKAKERRVLRGGSWYYFIPQNLLSSSRDGYPPLYRNFTVGFRCVVSEWMAVPTQEPAQTNVALRGQSTEPGQAHGNRSTETAETLKASPRNQPVEAHKSAVDRTALQERALSAVGTETGRVFAVPGTRIAQDGEVKKDLERPMEGSDPASPKRRNKMPTFETESYRIEVQEVKRSGKTILVTLAVENVTGGVLHFSTLNSPWYLSDEHGERLVTLAPDTARFHAPPAAESDRVPLGAAPNRPVIDPRGVEIPSSAKLKSRFLFTGSEENVGERLTLIAEEKVPQAGRKIIIKDINVD